MTGERNYFRVMLGAKSDMAQPCLEEGFIGAGFAILQDLSSHLAGGLREFNKEFIPAYQELVPGKSKIAAGSACGMLYTICKGIDTGDIVMSPDGTGAYAVGEVASEYFYSPGLPLPHRRKVNWHSKRFSKAEVSEQLQRAGSIGTVSSISKHGEEIDSLVGNQKAASPVADDTVEDLATFAMEKHLEDFLIENWQSCELGIRYDIFEDDGEQIGQQYRTDTGAIDILAISKDKSELLVVELKKGRASDRVVGQIQRYMGYLMEEVAEPNQTVRGCIIAFEDDLRIRRALKVNSLIDFYRYAVSFKLNKVDTSN